MKAPTDDDKSCGNGKHNVVSVSTPINDPKRPCSFVDYAPDI